MFLKRILPVALALGTAWAARGQIGHEYGAAWAGGIGVLALIAVSGRADWFRKLPTIVALGAIGWGLTGIVSYGKVVGYGHTADYINTSYSLLMLLLIGGLYGFIGGGLTGLALESSDNKKPDWAALITQMVAGGVLSWGLLINELEWFMTPPRSELWAACLGAAVALGWYLYRNGYTNALRTAWFAALGAGIGFALGNFLQRMGGTTGIKFNWWNVMEYSIGFCGGIGMAYGVFSGSNWPQSSKPDKMSNKFGWLFLIAIVPYVVIMEGGALKGTGKLVSPADPETFELFWHSFEWVMSALFAALLTRYYFKVVDQAPNQKRIALLTLAYLCWYVLISNIIGATWLQAVFSSQHLYWANIIALFFLLRNQTAFTTGTISSTYKTPLVRYWAITIVTILFISFVAASFGKVRHTEGRWGANAGNESADLKYAK